MKIPFGTRGQITTFRKQGLGIERVELTGLPSVSSGSLASREVSADQLRSSLAELLASRRLELAQGVARPVAPVLAKDASVNPAVMHMAYDAKDPQSLEFIREMAQIGRVEGFQVVAQAAPEELGRLRRRVGAEVGCLANPGGHDAWTEDHGEFTQAGEVVVPALMSADVPLDEWLIEDRARRYQALAEQGQPRPRVDYATQGLIHERRSQEELIANGLATGAPLKLAVSYVGGGNFLPGRRADGTPVALVGRDSLAITRELMREQLGDPTLDDTQALAQIARDYGLSPENVVPVEQPGDFHLDMDMALAGPGQVLLNDARKVAELQKEWLAQGCRWIDRPDEIARVDAQARKVAIFEDLVEQDLKRAGLEVYRVAGNFPASAANPPMNFLNMRLGTNEEGQAFAVTLGGDERAERAFAETLLQELGGFERVHFLSRALTAETLKHKGGIKCRTKVRA